MIKRRAGQINSDKVENVVMDGSKVGKFGKIERQQNLKSVVMDGSTVGEFGKVGKLENCRIHEGMWSQSEERLCKSITRGLARRSRENTRCWQMWKKKNKAPNALMTYRQGTAVARSAQGW